MHRKVINSLPVLAIIPVVNAAKPVQDDDSGPPKPPPMRASDLPIYDAPHVAYAQYLEDKKNEVKENYLQSLLEEPIRAFRQRAQTVFEHTETVTSTVRDNYNEFQDRTSWIVKYLREEENKEQRYGAVAIGGLTGFIFGLRGGIIRRLFYASIGTGIMGTVCFPEETNVLTKDFRAQGRRYINVAYNFCYGVKPGDPQLEVKFPELSFPKDFSEFLALTVSLGSSVKQAIMPPPTKDENEKPIDKKN